MKAIIYVSGEKIEDIIASTTVEGIEIILDRYLSFMLNVISI